MSKNNSNNGQKLLTDGATNAKLLKTMIKNNIHIRVFNLPVGETCPNAKYCIKDCYGKKGNYLYESNLKKYAYNLDMTKSDMFVDKICDELKNCIVNAVRIHSTGDFYDMAYFAKWVKIAELNPTIAFYGYTKSVSIVKEYEIKYGLPKNMYIAYSYGGKEDGLINPDTDKHSIVIAPNAEIPDGYVCGNDDDYWVVKADKIALRYHGSRKWENSDFKKVILPL